jgi:hypothetical protein
LWMAQLVTSTSQDSGSGTLVSAGLKKNLPPELNVFSPQLTNVSLTTPTQHVPLLG